MGRGRQMRISIAGAGAGKTTKMADRIISSHNNLAEHLSIYCITFTNNAVDCIINKLKEHFGSIPDRIKVSTIHSFLYHEIIKPYYFLLYGKQYEKISRIELPKGKKDTDIKNRNRIIKQLDDKNFLHLDCYSQRALWVMVCKSSDKIHNKNIRKVIHKEFIKYCGGIYIDEAQDIDKNVFKILVQLNDLGINIEIMGDPKQDLKGFGCLTKLVELYPQNVEYIIECHRCPQIHLDVSNLLISNNEKQKSPSNKKGELTYIFETDIDVEKYIEKNSFDLKYISEKNERYETNKKDNNTNKFDTLYYELIICAEKMYPDRSKNKIEALAYFWAKNLLTIYKNKKNAGKAMYDVFKNNRLDTEDYKKIIHIVKAVDTNEDNKKGIAVDTIDSIKGQEGNNCLFVLTTDLAEYLFGKKNTNNKTKNKLYVALTRSLNKLTILITEEVEKKYGRDEINKFFQSVIKKSL